MRKVLLVTAVCCVVAGPALADGGIDLYATYGEVIEGEAAFGLGARLDIGSVHWRLDAAVNGFAEVDDISDVGGVPLDDESVSIYAFDLGLRYIFKDGHSLRPYLGGGLTYLTADATSASIDAGFGAYGMAGLRYGKKPGINLMAELIYRFAEVDASSGLTDTTELDVGGLALQIGLSFVY